MIPFILGALGVVALSELTKKGGMSKMANGGGVFTYTDWQTIYNITDWETIWKKRIYDNAFFLFSKSKSGDYYRISLISEDGETTSTYFKNKEDAEKFISTISKHFQQEYYLVTFGYKGDDGYEIVTSKPILANSEEEASMKLKQDFEMNEGISCDIISVKKKI